MSVGYSKDHKTKIYLMFDVSTLKIKNTRDVIWLNKSYGELKGIKGHLSRDFELAEESGSKTDLSKLSKSKKKNHLRK